MTCGGLSAAEPDPAPQELPARLVVQLEGWSASPRNVEVDYAYIDPSRSLSGGGSLMTVTHGRDGLPKFSVGYRLPGRDAPLLAVHAWRQEKTGFSETGTQPGSIGALLASPDFAIGRSFVDAATAKSRVGGTLVDLDVSWGHAAASRAQLVLSTGVRLFRFEQDTTVGYAAADPPSGDALEEFVDSDVDARGFGPKASATFSRPIAPRTSIEGSIGVAVPVGTIRATATDTALRNGSFVLAAVVDRPGTRRAFLQLDGEVRVRVELVRGLSATAAYSFSYWSGVALEQRFVDVVSQNTTLRGERSVVYEGLSLGLRYEF